MTDRELLELAAKAVGTYVEMWGEDAGPTAWVPEDLDMNTAGPFMPWNPLTDDGDALRLAVALECNCWRDNDVIWCNNIKSVVGVDPCADMRRAIVRAAADIGRAMP